MSFSVNANLTLRSYYGEYRSYASKSDRKGISTDRLSFADSSALRRAIRDLQGSEYSDEKDLSDTTGKVKDYAKKLKAFVDSYNYTVDSGHRASSKEVARAVKQMKALTKDYKGDLDGMGIDVTSDGFLKLRDTSKIKTTRKYEPLFGSSSAYLKRLGSLARAIRSHVDLAL